MDSRPSITGVARRIRLLAVAFVAALAAGALMPTPAAAQIEPPGRMPPGGGTWCYSDTFIVSSVGGQSHQAYRPTSHFHNQSGTPATWHESISVTNTFRTTWSTTTTFQGGVDFWIIRVGVTHQTTVQMEQTITVNETTGFSVTVPPHTLMYADYGAYRTEIQGTYKQSQYKCGTNYEYETLTTGPMTVQALTSVGWRLWDA